MSEIKMLPLPEPKNFLTGIYSSDEVREIVASNVAARDAEIQSLRAEVKRQKEWLAWWGGFAFKLSTDPLHAEARAEQLEKALRDARQVVRELLPDATYTKWDEVLNRSDALRYHNQEGKDGQS